MAHIESLVIDIVKRSDSATGLVVLPRRRVVERTFAWLNRCRRLAKDWESHHRLARGVAPHRVHPPNRQTCRTNMKKLVVITSQTLTPAPLWQRTITWLVEAIWIVY